ncbi:MAG: TetR/AcrR family transcriptional regulator [Desulfobacterales bacterium]|jgi:AcrR family transcriptional regulator
MEYYAIKKNETTRRIKDAAIKIFAEAGFAGARVDEIAKRAGVNKAMIYYHIGGKQVLYGEVLHDVFRDMAQRMTRNIQQSQTAEGKLKRYIHNMAAAMDRHPYLPAIMQREIASGGKHLPELVIQDVNDIVRILAAILEEGAQQGIFIDTIPIIIHLMMVGAFGFYKAGWPIRSRLTDIPDDLKKLESQVSGKIASEIEKLILKAVEK